MATMRAAMQDRYGAPDVLHVATIDRPMPADGEVLVRIEAASVNGYDVLLRSGALKMVTGRKFPKQSGLDFVGTVAEVPAGGAFQPGDRVWGVLPLHRLGAIADYVAIAPQHLSFRPPALSVTDAAALPVVGATALLALRDVLRLQPHSRLLVRGAAGGVGTVAVQLAKAMGAHVTALAGARDLAFVRELGADEVADYSLVDPASLGRFDAILDTAGVDTPRYRALLGKGGRYAAIVPDPRHPLRWMAYVAWSRLHGGRRVRYFNAAPDTAALTGLAGYVDDGVVRPVVEAVYPLDRIADAHRAFEAKRARGKQIVSIA